MIRKQLCFALLATLVALGAVACDTAADAPVAETTTVTAEAKAGEPAIIEVASLDKALTAKSVTVCDANGAETRSEFGVIPGALLLTGSDYDLKTLPSDKAGSLVFYCSSEQCSAAPSAAKRALEAGYSDVKVLKAGIKGWTKAGKKTDKIEKKG